MAGKRKGFIFATVIEWTALIVIARILISRGQMAKCWPVLPGIIIFFFVIKRLLPQTKTLDYPTSPYYSLYKCDRMNNAEFQRTVAHLLEFNGYKNVEQSKTAGLHILDITAEKDGFRFGFVCINDSEFIEIDRILYIKKYEDERKKSYPHDRIIVVTNRTYLLSVVKAAEEAGIELWDREKLADLIAHVPVPK